MSRKVYTLEQIKKYAKEGFDYEIPEATMLMINRISKQVGAPSYVKTPIFKKKYDNPNKKNKRKKVKALNDNEWESLRTFETTKIERNEEGIQKEINNIKIHLNKLTQNTYDDVYNDIIIVISNLVTVADKEDYVTIGECIFEIGSANSFYSELYAKLYYNLMNKYSIMKEIFDINYKKFTKILETIQFENIEQENYNELCKLNSVNEHRLSLVRFISFLAKFGVIDMNDYINIIETLLNTFNKLLSQKNFSQSCEIIVDVLFVMITTYGENLNNHDKFETIRNKIEEYSEMNIIDYLSLTNKGIFKLMELFEEIEDW